MTDLIASSPAWFKAGMKDIGIKEERDNRGPQIARFIQEAKCGAQGSPWCAVWANAKLEITGHRGTRSALARSFEKSGSFIKLSQPVFGCVVTFWRGSKKSGLGHVGFYNGETNDYISTLGGNESDKVQVESYRRSSSTFGLSGYYWPAGVPTPQGGACRPQLPSGIGGKVT